VHVTRDGELLDALSPEARARTVRIAGEAVTVPRAPDGQRRRLVWPTVERIYRSLTKSTGASFATDFAVLAMVWLDTGHVFGDRSIARARRREAARGTIESQRVKPNRKAGKHRTYCGTVKVRFPDETARREARWRKKNEARCRRRERAAAAAAKQRPPTRRPSDPRPVIAPMTEPREPVVPLRAVASAADVLAQLANSATPGAPAAKSSSSEEIDRARARELEVARQLEALRAADLDDPPDRS
jgi:hypothetical protein